MSSQVPEDSAPASDPKIEAEIKAEETLVPENNATVAEPSPSLEAPASGSATASVPPPTPLKEAMAGGLTKKDFEAMNGILHRLTNYRDEEYVEELLCPLPHPH